MDQLNAQNAMMAGQAMFDKWYAEFMAKWNERAELQSLRMMYTMIPPGMKEEMKTIDPEGYENLISLLEDKE